MSAITRTQIPKPANFQDFERRCAVWWEHRLNDRNLQRWGRNGQRQNGVDIHGIMDGDIRKGVGIQCKLKDGHAELTEAEVKKEFKEALSFRPKLKEFHILTTSPTDTKLQRLALELSVEQQEQGNDIRFLVWGWNTISDEVGRHQETLLAFDESYGVFGRQQQETLNTQTTILTETREGVQTIVSLLQMGKGTVDSTVEIALAVEKHLDAEIDGYRDANNGGQRVAALGHFMRLLERVGDTASGRILFRIKANIGACNLNLGDDEAAIKWLLEAYDHAPSEPKAISNKALALLLQENFDEVLEMGRQNLESQVADPMLSSHVIQAARFGGFEGDPLALVPEKDRDTEGVVIALALYQRGRRDNAWRTTSWDAADRFPKEARARQLGAEATLDEVIGESGLMSHAAVTFADRARLEEVARVLRELWEHEKEAEGRFDEADIALCGNLVLAYRALGDFVSAMDTLKYALSLSEIDDEFILRASVTAMEAGDPLLEELLPRMADGEVKNLLTVQNAVTKGDWGRLADRDPSDDRYPESEVLVCQTAVRLAKLWKTPGNECAAALTRIVADVEGDVRSSVLVAQFCGTKGSPSLAETAWKNALSLIRDDTHISSRTMAAMYAVKHGLWSDAANLMYGHVALDQDGEELRALSSALVQERPIKQRAVDFFTALPSEIRTLPRYRYMEGLMEFNRGDLPAAEAIFRSTLSVAPDLQVLGMTVMALRRQNREPEISALLDHFNVEELDGTPIEKMTIAHEMRRAGREAEALDFAYPVLRENPNDPEVNVAYAILVFSMQNFGDLIAAPTVTNGTWVRLSGSQEKDFEFVVEEGANDPKGGYLALSHPLVAAAAGKAAGDTITMPQQFGDDITWTIAEIKHRYLYAFHDVLANFQTKFPDAHGMFSVSIKDDDLSSVIEQVRLLSERGEKAINLHVKSGLPIQLAAGLFNENPIAFALGIRDTEYDVRCCQGIEYERTAAFEIIAKSGRSGVVMDAHAAWTAATLDILDLIFSLLGPIYIPQSGRDDLLAFRGFDEFHTAPTMTLVHRNGETYRQEHTPEAIEARNQYVSQQLEKIEKSCAVVPAIAPNQLSALEDMILEKCGDRVMDAIFLCTGDRILISDDLAYRQFAAQTVQAKSTWLQAVLLYARETGEISEERYAEAVINLAYARHSPVAVDARLLKTVVEQDPSGELRTLEAVARYIGNANADYGSHIGVVRDFIIASALDRDMDRLRRQRAISILVRNLIRRTGEKWHWAMERLTDGLPPADREYLHQWMKGHFLNPWQVYGLRRAIKSYVLREVLARVKGNAETTSVRELPGPSVPVLSGGPSPHTAAAGRTPLISKRKRRRRKR